MQIKLPETVTQTVFITAYKSDINGGHTIMISCTDMSNVSSDYVVLGTEEITLNVPQVNFINEKVEKLNKQKTKIIIESQEAIKSIDSEIQLLTRDI